MSDCPALALTDRRREADTWIVSSGYTWIQLFWLRSKKNAFHSESPYHRNYSNKPNLSHHFAKSQIPARDSNISTWFCEARRRAGGLKVGLGPARCTSVLLLSGLLLPAAPQTHVTTSTDRSLSAATRKTLYQKWWGPCPLCRT